MGGVTKNMTSSNIKQACESAGFVATCACSDDISCTETALKNCRMPMTELSLDLCNTEFPKDCPGLEGVFIYFTLHGYDGVSGDNNGDNDWIRGSSYQDGFALCAENSSKLI